jgi:hypothetical protein
MNGDPLVPPKVDLMCWDRFVADLTRWSRIPVPKGAP